MNIHPEDRLKIAGLSAMRYAKQYIEKPRYTIIHEDYNKEGNLDWTAKIFIERGYILIFIEFSNEEKEEFFHGKRLLASVRDDCLNWLGFVGKKEETDGTKTTQEL